MRIFKSISEPYDILFASLDDVEILQESICKNQWTPCKLVCLAILFGITIIGLSIFISPWLILILPVVIIIASISCLVYIYNTLNNLIAEHEQPPATSNNSITINVIDDEHDES